MMASSSPVELGGRLLGAYAARTCPVAAQLDFDSAVAAEPLPPTEYQQKLIDAGKAFEASVFDELVRIHGTRVAVIDYAPKVVMQAATREALAAGCEIVLGGWLPDDETGSRTGRPDILLCVGDGWIPIEVKHHGFAVAAPGSRVLVSDLDDLHPDRADEAEDVSYVPGHLRGDGLQLAHYWRLLEVAGINAGNPRGGILAKDCRIWWVDLDMPLKAYGNRSALDVYDCEVGLRLRVADNQLRRNAEPSISRLVIPLRKHECPACRWREVCYAELKEKDDVSLLARTSWPKALKLIRDGVESRHDLASPRLGDRLAGPGWPTRVDQGRSPEDSRRGERSETRRTDRGGRRQTKQDRTGAASRTSRRERRRPVATGPTDGRDRPKRDLPPADADRSCPGRGRWTAASRPGG